MDPGPAVQTSKYGYDRSPCAAYWPDLFAGQCAAAGVTSHATLALVQPGASNNWTSNGALDCQLSVNVPEGPFVPLSRASRVSLGFENVEGTSVVMLRVDGVLGHK